MYEQVSPSQDLATYGSRVIETLLRNLAFSIHKALERADTETVRELRMNCLRLRHALRLFAKVYPAKPVRKIQRRVASLRDLVAAVYACDTALETLKVGPIAAAAGPRRGKEIAAEVGAERRRCLRPLRLRLRKMQRSDALQRWRTRLAAPAG